MMPAKIIRVALFALFLIALGVIPTSPASDSDVLVRNTLGAVYNPSSGDSQPGRLDNNTNAEIMVSTVNRGDTETEQEVMPGQSYALPPDTVEVQAEFRDEAHDDLVGTVDLLMPDGSTRSFKSLPATARIQN